MPNKTIFEVDIDTSKMQRFGELFERYQNVLAKTPSAWKSVNKEAASAATQFERMAAALMAQNTLSQETKDAEEKRQKRLVEADRLWSNMAKSSKTMAKSVLDIGAGILKWGAIIGGGLLGGSLFGIDKMAASVSNSRRSAMGLGLSIGEQKAFNINFERLLDPNFLSQVAEMKMDPSKAGPLYAMGVGTQGSTEDTAVALLKAMRSKAVATPVNMLGLLDAMTGLNAGVEEWRRLHDMKGSEFNSLLAGNKRDASGLNIGEGAARQWQEFTTQMQRAESTIFRVFVQGLTPLAGPLMNLSKALVGLVERVFPSKGGGPLEQGIKDFADWIGTLSGKLEAPAFLASVDKFVSNMGALGDTAQKVREAIADPLGTAESAAGSAIKADFMAGPLGMLFGANFSDTWLGKIVGMSAQYTQAISLGNKEKNYGLPAGLLSYVYGHGSSFGQDPKETSNLFGLTGDAAKGVNRADFEQSSDRAAEILAKELKHYHGDAVRAVAAYNIGEGGVAKAEAQYGKDWQKHVPYVADIKVVVNNNTGGSAQVSVNALAGGH